MATVTRQFKEDFDAWAAYKVQHKDFSSQEIEELKALLRIDFAPGPDQLRANYKIISEAGIEVPAAIDNHEERYRVWSVFFADEAEQIRRPLRKAA